MCFKRIHILAVGICVSWPFGHFFGRFPKINKPHNLGGASWGIFCGVLKRNRKGMSWPSPEAIGKLEALVEA